MCTSSIINQYNCGPKKGWPSLPPLKRVAQPSSIKKRGVGKVQKQLKKLINSWRDIQSELFVTNDSFMDSVNIDISSWWKMKIRKLENSIISQHYIFWEVQKIEEALTVPVEKKD